MKKGCIYLLTILTLIVFNVKGQNPVSRDTKASDFKPSGVVWGYVFGDYYTKLHADSLNRGVKTQYAGIPRDFNAFAFRRINLGYDYQVSEKFSTQFLLANENDNLDASGERTVFIKAANIKWKNIFKNTDLVIGQSATPFYALLTESVWGYRSVEKTIADQRGLCASNDLGITLQGRLNNQGDYGYNIMVANGTSQKPETNMFKKVYAEVYAKFLGQKLIFDLAAITEAQNRTTVFTTIKGFAAYQAKPITAGIEVVSQNQSKAATLSSSQNENITPFGVSLFVHGLIKANKLNYFLRYDSYNANTRFNADQTYTTTGMITYKENFFTGGLDYTPHKNFHIMPNIWYDQNNSMKNNVTGREKSDYDLVARLTVHFIFR